MFITKDSGNPKREYWVMHNEHGMLDQQGYMSDGKRDGVWREYHGENGMLSKLVEYKNGILDGPSVTFLLSGTVSLDETYKNDKLDGSRIEMNSYGNLKTLETYKDGK